MKKRVLSVLLTLVMLLSLLPMAALAVTYTPAYANSFEYLKTYLGSSSHNYEVTLSDNINITETITIPASMNAVLNMNGYKLYRNTDNIAFEVKGTLTVINSSGTTSSEFHGHSTAYYNTSDHKAYSEKTLFFVNGGTLNLNEEYDNGKITLMNNQAHDGGAVLVENGGTVNMYDGITIYHCQAEGGTGANHGGAVYVNNGSTFNMHGGTIDGCIAQYGGAVCTHESVFNMDGGTIQNCTLAGSGDHRGGAIYLWGHKSTSQMTTISGGTIQNNGGKDVDTGGIYVDDAYLTVEGNVQFIGNSSEKEGWPSTLNVIALGTITVKGGYFGQQGSGGGKTITYYGSGEDLKITGGKFYIGFPNKYEYKNDSNEKVTLSSSTQRACSVYVTAGNGDSGFKAGDTYWGGQMPEIKAGAPTRTGYTFKGYYDQYNEQYYNENATRVKYCDYIGTMELHGDWTPKTYSITYKDEGNVTFSGTHASGKPTTHTYDTETTLKDPTKDDYTFVGWYTDSACTDGKKVTSLGKTAYTDNITLYAKWKKDVACLGAYSKSDKTNCYDTFAGAVTAQTTQTDKAIYLHATPLAKEENVSVNSGVTIELFDNAGSITTTASSVFDYLKDGTLVLKSGGVQVNGTTQATFYVYYPNDTETPHKLEIKQDGSNDDVSVSYGNDSVPVIGNLGENDKLFVDGMEITVGGTGNTIKLTDPPQPFPGATKITIPAGQGGMTSVSPDGTSPAVGTPSTDPKNQGSVIITPPDEDEDGDGFPVKILVKEDGDQVIIDPDGEGGSKPPVSYETTQENTELEVNNNGKVVLADGGVELDEGESIRLKNSKGEDLLIEVPKDENEDVPTVTVEKDDTDPNLYTLTVPENGSITIDKTTYEIPDNKSNTPTEFKITLSEDEPVVELVSGTVELNGGEDKEGGESEKKESIVVDDVTVTNESEQPIRITETKEQSGPDDGKFDIQTGTGFGDTYHYSKGDGDNNDLTVKKNGDDLQFVLNEPKEQVSFTGETSQNVEFSDGNNVFVTVDKDSEGEVTVENTSTTEPDKTGMTITIVNGAGKTTTAKVGGTSYTVPESTTTTLSVDSDDGVAVMCGEKGAVTMPTEGAGNAGKVYVDNVLVSNTSGADLTVTDNIESHGDDGLLTLRSGTDTFYYTAAAAYVPTTVYDLDVKKNDSTGNLQFVLNTTGEKVNFTGAKSTNVEFAADNGKVCVIADKNSAGEITVTKGSFTVDVNNASKGASTVKVGAYTYTVPANKKATLKLTADDPTEVAKLHSGTVELGKTDSEAVIIPTTKSYTVKNGTASETDKVIEVTANTSGDAVTGADILVPSGLTFTVIPNVGNGDPASYTAAGKLASKYVTDSSGNVSLNGKFVKDDETANNPGVQLVLTEGNVTLDPGETVYTNSTPSKVILNSNASGTITPTIVTSGDTDIVLEDGQKVTIGARLLNGAVQAPKGIYVACIDGTTVSIDNDTDPVYDPGTVKLKSGTITLEEGSIGVGGAKADFMVSVPAGKGAITLIYDNDGVYVKVAPGGGFTTTVDGEPDEVNSYVNESSGEVTVFIKNNGDFSMTLTGPYDIPGALPEGSYEAFLVREVNEYTRDITFVNSLAKLLSKEEDALESVSGNYPALQEGDTVVLNTAVKPTTDGKYILTTNGIDIYTAQGNLAKLGRGDTDYEISGVSGIYTVDARERAEYYKLDQTVAEQLEVCMVVKISNETNENGHVEVQAGEAKIKWSNDDTTYYVTLADAIYDAAHNKADGTSVNVYNTHDGRGSAQAIQMNINPYEDRTLMLMENGDVLMTCGEDSSKPGDTYRANYNAVISMFESRNDVYLVSGTLTASVNTEDSDKTVTVYLNTTDNGYYAEAKQSITVTGGKTADAERFAAFPEAARVLTTVPGQTVKVGVGGEDTVFFSAVHPQTFYPVCRVGLLNRPGDKAVMAGGNGEDYAVYSLLRVFDKDHKPLEPKYEYAKIFVPAANTGDTSIVNGMEQNKLGTVRVNSAAANDKFILWMPQELLPLNYSVAEADTAAVLNAPHELTLISGGYRFIGERTFRINGVDFKGKDAATGYTVAHRSDVDIVDICDEVYGVSAGKTVYVSYNEGGRTVKYGDKTYTSTNSSAAVMIPGKTANVDPAGGSDIYADYQDRTHRHFYVKGPVFSGHAVKIDETDKGTVESDPRTAMAGTVVTLTASPDKGYKLKSLRVLDFNGNEVKLTDLGDGKYSFTMPGSSVTVKAEFIGEGEIIGFVDVPADAYYADAVAWAVEKEITLGKTEELFAPNDSVSRAQVVTFLWRAAGKPVVNYAMSFADVSGDAYYAEAVRWAVAEGITNGMDETHFAPNASCTRGQIVTFLYRYAKAEAVETVNPFTDVEETNYFYDAVLWALANGVTGGKTATTFAPTDTCNRAQVVTFLYRYMGK